MMEQWWQITYEIYEVIWPLIPIAIIGGVAVATAGAQGWRPPWRW